MSKPKRSNSRWLTDAPDYVLSVHDAPRYDARYSVLLGEPHWEPVMGTKVQCLSLCDQPDNPMGISEFCEVESRDRGACGKKVRWLDLPLSVRKHIKARCKIDSEALA